MYSAPTRRKSRDVCVAGAGRGRAGRRLQPRCWEDCRLRANCCPTITLSAQLLRLGPTVKQGMVACIPASQWQLRQIALLDAEGTAPPWKFLPNLRSDIPNQYFAAAIVDTGLEDAQARVDVCREVVAYLTSEDAQARPGHGAYAACARGYAAVRLGRGHDRALRRPT